MRSQEAVIARLRKEVVKKLQMEHDSLEEAAAFFAKESMRSSASWRSTEGEAPGVSRSGSYGWLTCPRSQRSLDEEVLGRQVRQSFLGGERTCGAR